MRPTVSVIVVSDYESGHERGWDDLRATLAALVHQDFNEPVEHLLVETPEFIAEMPPDLLALLPGVRVVPGAGKLAYQLMGAGAAQATGEIVAILEGDCAPKTSWLRASIELMRAHPDAAAASGRTLYPDTGLLNRCMSTITRGFIDTGHTAPTRHLTHNNCVFRREVLAQHPFPERIGPHMSSLHAQAITSSGGRLYFEPRMEIVHAYSGWSHESGMRRSLGYAVVRVRQEDPQSPYRWLIRLGPLSVPLFILLRSLNACWQCVRVGHTYGIAWYELPVGFAFSFAATALEWRGMWNALRGLPVPNNPYR